MARCRARLRVLAFDEEHDLQEILVPCVFPPGHLDAFERSRLSRRHHQARFRIGPTGDFAPSVRVVNWMGPSAGITDMGAPLLKFFRKRPELITKLAVRKR